MLTREMISHWLRFFFYQSQFKSFLIELIEKLTKQHRKIDHN